ncbi:MAG: PaaI family thioesterase [Burkholderiaceae bacterium]
MNRAHHYNERGRDALPGHLGLEFTEVGPEAVHARLPVGPQLMAPNGFLHAATIIALADTSAGYGCVENLPPGAVGFTTVELKSNFMGTAREGTIECIARPAHLGRTTQIWDAEVSHHETGKTLALFRCTQMILYPKAGS